MNKADLEKGKTLFDGIGTGVFGNHLRRTKMRLGVHNYPAEAEETGTSIGARFGSDGESERSCRASVAVDVRGVLKARERTAKGEIFFSDLPER